MEQGDDVIENESNYEQRLEAIRRTEAIDQKFGYQGYTEPAARDAWLVNVQPSEMVDDQTKVILSVCDFYFLQENGDRFKISYPFRPYLFLMVISSHEHQACAHLLKKYHGIITADVIEKEDLDLKNHLSGLKRKVIKVSFPSMNELAKFKKDLMPIIRKNQEREERTTAYTSLLAKHLGGDRDARDDGEILEKIVDIREHDLPYQMRVCIDEKYFIGAWYEVIGRDASRRPSIKRHPSLIDQPEPVVLAFDIEVTKLPLKFPDSTIDEIMMISYMIDGNGFLIINRKVVADNIEDFEYTPKPEYKGVFTVFNEKDETAVIKCFFDHILRVRPSIFATYNGDSFDWPFIEARATLLGIDMFDEIGFCKDGNGDYRNTNAIHMDVFRWVKRDSYLPVGSQNLKACTKAKLRYDPVELDPEEMLPMARNDPQTLASYSVSDAVATYYLYMKYVHPFIFALCTIIPLAPDDVLRKGSGTLCEALLMVEAHHKNILFPNKKIMSGNKFTSDGHAVESETYVGGHVEAIESGVYRADIPCRFRMIPATLLSLKKGARKALHDALVFENSLKIEHIADFDEVCSEVEAKFDDLLKHPNRNECPKIYHLDVGAMYPNIILTNRLQPSAVVEDEDCIACVYNVPEAKCKRKMQWEWRGEVLPASRGEYERIFQQLENEKFGKPPRAFHALSRDERTKIEKKRVLDFCKKAYGRTHLTRTQFRYSVICQRENGFYVNTVRAFRDRRYEYKDMLKKAKAALESIPEHDVAAMKSAQGRVVLYDSLQLAHKCILNSFYGYVMRKGSRWFSMEMAGIVCHTGANLITEARKLVEQIGMPLELDTDGIWCLLPESFPENFTFHLSSGTNRSIKISYPGAMLNALVRDKFTNDQYHHLQADGSYTVTSENSIFFEVDGPYLAMILPASKEEGKKLKKRYAVFNFDGSLAELKGFEVKRRGELAMIKYFQSSVFKAFLYGKNLSEVYSSVAKEADYWLDVLFSKGEGLRDDELFDLIAENRSMTRKLEDYGEQKSTSISTAKRLAEFLGNDMVRDAGLACRFIISRKPIGAPVTERAIPLAVFNVERGIAVKYLRKWTKDSDIDLNFDIRNIIDWDYYVDRVGGTIQKIISIPAVLQGISNPVPRIPLPDWLVSKRRQRLNDRTQSKITDLFRAHGDNQSITKNLSLKSKAERDFCTESSSQEMDGARKRGHTHPSGKDKDGCDKAGDSVPAKKSCREERSVVKKTIIEDGVVEWIQYLKRKWKKMLENRKTIRQTRIGKGQNNLHSFLEKSRAHMQRERWQILQISESNEKGRITVWAMINGRMNKLLVKIPRVFYVNERESRPHSGIPVKRILPRTKPVLNLYEYSVEESRFLSKMSKLNRELCAMRIEGIYGTSTPPLFRAIVQLGCCCRVRSKMDFSFTGLSVDDLERISGPDFEYLPSKSVRSLFFFEHHQDSRCVMAIFNTALTEAIVIVVNRGDISLPSLSTIYATEQERLSNTNPDFERRGEIKFRVSQCSTMREADRIVQKYLREIRQTDSFPTVIMVQSNEAFSSLTRRISILADYPLVRIHSKEPTNLFNQIDWQRIVFRRLIQHFFNSFIYLQDYVEISRYLHVPLGNIPDDTFIFGADVFFARNLIRSGYVLWASPTNRPDLGGKELNGADIGAEWETLAAKYEPSSVINTSSFETDVCFELELGVVAVSALIQSSRIAEAEGSSDFIGFASNVALESDALVGHVKSIAEFDEAAAVSGALKVLRSMLQDCVRDIHANNNQIADQLVVNIHRWIRTPSALLFDPAIERAVDILITKLCLLLVAEINRLGGNVLHASYSRFVISTQRSDPSQARSFIDSLLRSLSENPLFAALNISKTRIWNVLAWINIYNFAGITFGESGEDDLVSAKFSIADFLPEEAMCRETFGQMIAGYLALVGKKLKATREADELVRYRQDLVSGEISERLFRIISKLLAAKDNITMPSPIGSLGIISNAPLQLAISVIHVLSFDDAISEPIEKMRCQLMKLLGISEASDESYWRPPGVSLVIPQLFCRLCNQYSDLEVCQKETWSCINCNGAFQLDIVEQVLVDRVNQLLFAYSTQDLKCSKCSAIKKDTLSLHCECSGQYVNVIDEREFELNLRIYEQVGNSRQLNRLSELCNWVLTL